MASQHVIDVNEDSFEQEVLSFSQNIPVLVDFWAEWCVPCKTLDPMLKKMAEEAKGAFRLAKIDVDYNKNLPLRYGIRSIPTIKAFIKGQVFGELTGLQPEVRLKEFLRNIIPSPADLLVEKGNSLIGSRNWVDAEAAFREALDLDLSASSALLGLARSLLALGKVEEALSILRRFPASHEYSSAEKLLPLAEIYTVFARLQDFGEDPLEAAMWNSVKLARRGNFQAALDGLLDILRMNKNYKQGTVKQIVLGILELMGDNHPDTRQYRAELASILF